MRTLSPKAAARFRCFNDLVELDGVSGQQPIKMKRPRVSEAFFLEGKKSQLWGR